MRAEDLFHVGVVSDGPAMQPCWAAGSLRAVAHVAGISPTMADWKRIFTVDLIGTARLAAALRPLLWSVPRGLPSLRWRR